jgi:hypothetical protein
MLWITAVFETTMRQGSVWEPVLSLLLAVLRVTVHDRLAQRAVRKLEVVEPEPLDQLLARQVIREKMAGDADITWRDEVRLQEVDEEPT